MNEEMHRLFHFHLLTLFVFFLSAIWWALIIRIFLSFLRAIAAETGIRKNLLDLVLGTNSVLRKKLEGENIRQYWQPDYWHAYFLGVFELSAFPVLLAADMPNYIAAWIGLKTLAQWNKWKEDRTTFNIFLIGQGLILSISYMLVRFWRM